MNLLPDSQIMNELLVLLIKESSYGVIIWGKSNIKFKTGHVEKQNFTSLALENKHFERLTNLKFGFICLLVEYIKLFI